MPAVTVTAAALGTLLQQQLVVDVYIVIPVMVVTVTKSNSVATVKGTAYNIILPLHWLHQGHLSMTVTAATLRVVVAAVSYLPAVAVTV